MQELIIRFNGRSYECELRYPGLNKYEVVRAKTEYEVQEKARAKTAQWDEMWRKKQAAEQASAERENKKEVAMKRTAHAESAINSLKQLLSDTLAKDDRIAWETLKRLSSFSKPKPLIVQSAPPSQPAIPPAPSRSYYEPQFGLLDRLSANRRNQKIEAASRLFEQDHQRWLQQKGQLEQQFAAAQQVYKQRCTEWEQQVKQAESQWLAEKQQFEHSQAKSNAKVDQLKERYEKGQPEAILEYCKLVLSNSRYPSSLPKRNFILDYTSDTKMLVVEYTLPSPADMPRLKEVKYVQSRDALDEVMLSDSYVNSLYDEVLYQIVLRTIHELYEADVTNAISSIVFNGWVTAVDKSTGQEVNSCILSLQAGREEFIAINLAQVNPKDCFKRLKGVGSSKLHGLSAVAPILQLNRDDKRFIAGREVAEKLSEGDNLAIMDWEDFEHLVRELFEKEFMQSGGEVKVTQASRDRGVDAIAFDPDPIRGGKIVIQAKRYANTVDVSAVRDLYGAVMNEGATKGILVTTSNYGPEAYEFAKGKPLTLLNGGNLLSLLEKHGHKARIDLQEAKKLLSQS